MKIVFVDGGKGGVGKSTIALAVTDILYHSKSKVALVDADVRNPDAARITSSMDDVETMIVNLRTSDDWSALLGEVERLANEGNDYCVVSLAAGENSVQDKASTAASVFKIVGISCATIHVMNRGVDSLAIAKESLGSGLASISEAAVAVLNGYFGEAESFHRWNASKTRRAWQKRGFIEAWVPELYWQCVDAISEHQRLPSDLATDAGVLNAVNRIQILEWIATVRDNLVAPLGLLEMEDQGGAEREAEAAANG